MQVFGAELRLEFSSEIEASTERKEPKSPKDCSRTQRTPKTMSAIDLKVLIPINISTNSPPSYHIPNQPSDLANQKLRINNARKYKLFHTIPGIISISTSSQVYTSDFIP